MFQRKDELQSSSHHGEQMEIETFEELAQRAIAQRYEYSDGRAYAMSGGTAIHNRLTFNMAKLIDAHLMSGPCRTFIADMYVGIAENRVLPDVVVTSDIADYRGNATLIRAPHLIVEVLSPSTERIDRNEKFAAYKQLASLQEYVLVNQKLQKVEVYRKTDDWVVHSYGPGEIIELASLDIFIPLDELYATLL